MEIQVKKEEKNHQLKNGDEQRTIDDDKRT